MGDGIAGGPETYFFEYDTDFYLVNPKTGQHMLVSIRKTPEDDYHIISSLTEPDPTNSAW